MSITTVTFFVFALTTAALYQLFRHSLWRHSVLLAANVVFFASQVDPLSSVIPFVAFLLAGYGSYRLVVATKEAYLSMFLLAGIIIAFVYLKRYDFVNFVPELTFGYAVIGLSYVLFRILQVHIDAWHAKDEVPIGMLSYANFCISFLTLVAGPIQRSQQFTAQVEKPERITEPDCLEAARRVARGLALVILLSAAFNGLFETFKGKLFVPNQGALRMGFLYAGTCTLYFLYLYTNFAGYTDIVIGTGRLFGFRLPENFNQPLSATNLIDYWSRWHMSLSEWFKVYVYNPLMLRLVRSVSRKQVQPFLAVFAFFITFSLIGVWHGSTWVYVFYGFYLGLAISLNKLTQVVMTERLGQKKYRALRDKRSYALVSRGLTLASIATALTCFWTNNQTALELLNGLGVGGALFGGLMAVGLGMAIAVLWDFALVIARTARDGWIMRAPAAAPLAVASAQIIAVVMLATLFNAAPDFVYRAY
jgi:alginate O-acetyltransferase complex protein AlgI